MFCINKHWSHFPECENTFLQEITFVRRKSQISQTRASRHCRTNHNDLNVCTGTTEAIYSVQFGFQQDSCRAITKRLIDSGAGQSLACPGLNNNNNNNNMRKSNQKGKKNTANSKLQASEVSFP